jgi:hypothetical protein
MVIVGKLTGVEVDSAGPVELFCLGVAAVVFVVTGIPTWDTRGVAKTLVELGKLFIDAVAFPEPILFCRAVA